MNTREAAVVVDQEGKAIYWHLPINRTVASLPDSRDLWDVLWENRKIISGVAHSHPGSGISGPSWEDLTTFAAIEAGLGRRLTWWITTEDHCITLEWKGPGAHDYVAHAYVWGPGYEGPAWLSELREHSKNNSTQGG